MAAHSNSGGLTRIIHKSDLMKYAPRSVTADEAGLSSLKMNTLFLYKGAGG